jgi:Na+/melibiose symporter-like transporter
MFFSGLFSSFLVWFIFNSLEESPFFQERQKQKAAGTAPKTEAPVKTLFSSSWRNVLLLNLLVTFGGGAGYYITSGYLPTFLKVVNGIPNNVSSLILIGGSVVTIISAISIGALSDLIGRKKTFIVSGVCMIVLLPLCYLGMAATKDTTTITLYALAISFLGNSGYAPILIFLNERFPTEIRASGTGLSWNIGFALGGIMPTFVSLFAGNVTNIPVTLAMFAIGIFVVYLIGAFLVPETKGNFR